MYPLFKASHLLQSDVRVNWRIIRTKIKFLPTKSCCTSHTILQLPPMNNFWNTTCSF